MRQAKIKKLFNDKSALVIALALVVLAVLPWVLSGYWVRLLTHVFMFAVLAKAIDLMMGFIGYVPFGNVVFFGLGAYSAGISMSAGFNFFPAMLVGILVSAVVCVVFGTPVLRLRGHYFAVATVGLNGAIMAIALNATGLTGGAMGIIFPVIEGDPATANRIFYFAMMGMMIIAVLINIIIVKSRMGFAIRSIKSNEDAARSLGINTTFYKTFTWMINAAITGTTGAIYGYWMGYISTTDVFNLMISVSSILMVLLGGIGTILGPIVGAFIFQVLSEVIWSQFINLHTGILGLITIFVILFLPRGILTGIREMIKERKGLISKKAVNSND
jgi:branched-chain amino acid transport system permease protein